MATTLRQFLSSIGCEQYTTIFERNGYSSVNSLSTLDEAQLASFGVSDAAHRQKILSKLSGGEDFDNMLGDLDSVIKDLEMFTVPKPAPLPLAVAARIAPVNPVVQPVVAPRAPAPSVRPKPVAAQPLPPQRASQLQQPAQPKQTEPDFDLDSLLDDLKSFNPTETVRKSVVPTPLEENSFVQVQPKQPPNWAQPVPPPQSVPLPQSVPPPQPILPANSAPTKVTSTPSPHGTPVHGSSGPSTPGHTLQRSNTMGLGGGSQPELLQRSQTMSGADEFTMVPQPELQGASDIISAEEVHKRLEKKAEELRNDPSLTDEQREEKMKEENVRIALEKMKIAHQKRVPIKVVNTDKSNKTVVVEEGMTSSMVCHLLVVKNHYDESPNWTLVEQLGDVSLERELEDHEQVVNVYSTWPRENNNVLLFRRNEKKYDLFEDPMKYFPTHLATSQAASKSSSASERAEKARKILLQEYFSSNVRVPELEGYLHFKEGYNKKWKKVYFILRASGLYYSTKGKSKNAKDLMLLVQFEDTELYMGMNLKKTLKAETDLCFALRPIPKQSIPGPDDIRVLCADEEATYLSWVAGIRLAKYGNQLKDNFYKAKKTQFKLEDLNAPTGAPKAEEKSHKLVGMRLEKHLDKIREQYQAQKNEEEERKTRYRDSPHIAHKEVDPNSNELTSSQTPEASPVPTQRGLPPTQQQGLGAREESPAPVAPTYPASGGLQHAPPPARSEAPPMAPPTQHPQPPPPFVESREISPALVNGTGKSGSPMDGDALFQYAWYHGSITREDATTRLDKFGGFDGCYLVRASSTVSNSYVLTMFAKGVAKNFQILPSDSNGTTLYRIDDGPGYPSIDQLLRHYKQDSDRLPCRLTEFCPRPPTRMTEC